MTRPLSDAQLDAEAATRRPLEEQALADLIADHRALFRADVVYRLHDRSGDDQGIGVPFAEPFARYIDWKDAEQERGVRPSHPGQAFPWSTAFWAQWAECRRFHPEHHDRPEWRGSLCRQLVSLTVRNEMALVNACLVLGLTPPRAGRTLRNALLWIEGSMTRTRQRQQQDAQRQAPYEVWAPPQPSGERHDQPGLHQLECRKCRKARHAA